MIDPATITMALSLAKFVPQIFRWLGGDGAADVAEKVVKTAEEITGEAGIGAVSALEKDPALALQYRQAVLEQQLELERIALRRDEIEVEDRRSARLAHAGNDGVFRLGIAVLFIFASVIAATLLGVHQMLRGGVAVEAGMFAALSGFVGTIVGYVSAKADQVLSYFFGSSIGSKQKTESMATAVAQAVTSARHP